MKRGVGGAVGVVAALGLGLGLVSGCGSECGPAGPSFGGMGGEAGAADDGNSGGTGGLQGGTGGQATGGASGTCDTVANGCKKPTVLHVSPLGIDSGDGSAIDPVRTLGEALNRVALAVAAGAEKPFIFLCATAGTFEESFTIGAAHGDVSIHGSFDCDLFDASEERAVVVADEPSGHRIEGGIGVRLTDLRLQSPDASAPGESSIALTVVSSSGVRILRSELVAGAGAEGEAGMGYLATERAEAGVDGNPGHEACGVTVSTVNGGGAPVVTSCSGLPTASVGGLGGPGEGGWITQGSSSGDHGAPGGGNAGAGETASSVCNHGGNGETGDQGTHGAPSAEFGVLGPDGYSPPAGGAGAAGSVGGGGGGGGGAAKPSDCDTGASGGSGSGGGCPGAGAGGGRGGGGSFGLVSLTSQVSLAETHVAVAPGGQGGAGGVGQLGGNPGISGEGGTSGPSDGSSGCFGGQGGQGGHGGSGGGGAGGPSIGVAYLGQVPVGLTQVVYDLPITGAQGGLGGSNPLGVGPSGVLLESWNFGPQ